jgi:hypothetical protein
MRLAGLVARRWARQRERGGWKDQEVGRCVDNIMMDLLELGWSDVDWIGLVQDRNR